MKDYGTWLTWGWCPWCKQETEQERRHRRPLAASADAVRSRTRTHCLTCAGEVRRAGEGEPDD